MKRLPGRNKSGATLMVVVMALAFTVLPVAGLFAFEVGRGNLCQQQLQNAVDSASLTAVATLASADQKDTLVAHNNCIQAALKVFKRNTILGMDMNTALIQGSPHTSPPVGVAHLFFEFLDPVTKAVVPVGDARGKIVRVYGSVGTLPAFGQYLGIGNYIVRTTSHGAVPELDVVLCFDCSGSIDDQTLVTATKRVWRGTAAAGAIAYEDPAPTPNGKCRGTIYELVMPPPTGTGLNAIPPQGMTGFTVSPGAGAPPGSKALWFSEYLADAYGVPGLRAANAPSEAAYRTEAGWPPGNYPAAPTNGAAPTFDGFGSGGVYTDMVVNIDGKTTYGGTAHKGFDFPTVASLVEASRGNLENTTVYNDSKANTSCPTVTPKAGYQAAYFDAAKGKCQPIQDARDASQLFADIINNDTHAHFSFVAFSGITAPPYGVGTDETSTIPGYQFCDSSKYGTRFGVPIPLSPLDPSPSATRYTNISNAIPLPVANGNTNIGAAVNSAVDQLMTNNRPNAVKAIVLFTDGQPTQGNPLDSDPWRNARLAAKKARDKGIPVYTIGLAQVPAIIPGQTAILNDTNSDPNSGGIAAISGQGASFNIVTDSKQLRATFEKIARHLVQLVQEQ